MHRTVFVACCLCLVAPHVDAQTIGPVAAYAFSEGDGAATVDASGRGNAGALTTSSLWSASGRYGNALTLSGGSDGVTVPASPLLDVGAGLTIEAWVRLASIEGYPKILWRDGAWRDGATGPPYYLGLANGTGTVAFGITTTSGAFTAFAYAAVTANRWTHVAATYDGSALRVYVNGVLVGSAGAEGSILPSTGNLWLGRAPWGEGLTGVLDEIRIYDRALSVSEIAADRDAQISQGDPPDVGDRAPAAGTTGVPSTGVVRAVFSKPMDPATIDESTFFLTGPSGAVPASTAYDGTTRVATLTPSAPLARMTTYSAQITAGATDLDEGSVRMPVMWTFTTGTDSALAHAAYSFGEGSGDVSADVSANGNIATLTAAGLWTAAGRYGNGLALGGGTDGARVAAAPSLELTSGLTLEAWVKASSIVNYPKLIWRDGVDGSPYNLGMAWGNGAIVFTITTSSGSYSAFAWLAIVPNMWTHVAATYDGSFVRVFIDGQLANDAPASGAIIASTRDLWVGRAPWGEGFIGSLDDIRIYGRALSAAEIVADMGTPAEDATPPTVVNAMPRGPLVDPASNIIVTFDEAMARATLNASTLVFRDGANAVVPAVVGYDEPTRTVTLRPAARLNELTAYTVTVGTRVTSAAGVSLQNDYAWSFSTRDATFTYGVLAAPVATPVGGRYPAGQIVELSAAPGAEIRYTLDGMDPDAASALYVVPLHLDPGSVTLKARAFRADWTPSAAIAESYTIAADILPPTITASFSPPPNAAGWNNTDVTVTFTCADPSGVLVCTRPTTVKGEGYEIPVTAFATSVLGNHYSSTWTLNIDRTPPSVHVYAPLDGSFVSPGTTSVTVRGGVAELSGLDAVSCNGMVAVLNGNLFACTVIVADGPNRVTIAAADLAGNRSSTALGITVGDAPVSSIEISPGTMTMVAGDVRDIVVTDQNGHELHDGAWTIGNAYIAEVSDLSDATTITALSGGETTITVTSHEHTARATVTVLAAGSGLPGDAVLWSLSDTSGFGIPKRGEVLRASAGVAGDPARAPALVFVDEGIEWQSTTLLRTYDRPTRIRTTTVDGRQLSDVKFAGRVPQQIAADANGGFIVVLPAAGGLPATIQRFDAASGSITWDYISTSGFLSNVAIHPDGTVYATEHHITGFNAVVAIEASGLIRRSVLPRGHSSQFDTGFCGFDSDGVTPGYVTGPIVLEDGSVALVTRIRNSTQLIYTTPNPDAPLGCNVESHVQDYAYSDTSYLIEILQDGTRADFVLDDPSRYLPAQFYAEDYQLLPDGHGGILLARRSGPSVIRINANHAVVASNLAILPLPNGTTRYEAEYALAEDGAYVLINSFRRTPTALMYESKAVQFDPETLAKIDDSDLGIPMTEPQNLRLKFALAGGGIYAVGPTSAFVVKPTVDIAGFAAGGNASHFAGDLWGGWTGTGTPSVAPGTEPVIAQSRWAYSMGLENANAPSPRRLTTTRLRELAGERGIGAGMTGIQLNRQIGLAFQGIAIWSMYQREDSNTFFLPSPARAELTGGAVQNVVPDFLGPYQLGTTGPKEFFLDSVLTEVKAVKGLLSLRYSRYQIQGFIDAARLSPLGQTERYWPMVEFITTDDTLIGLDTIEQATSLHVQVRQRVVSEYAGGYLRVGSGRSLNGSFWDWFVTGNVAYPALLPGHAAERLGTHIGESPVGDPDPPSIEP